jgi:glycosyltransferase involved in cell wall biosynthesis
LSIRVLLVTDEMETGGTQRQISLLARGLDKSAFRPEIAYFRNRSFLVDELVAAGIAVTEIPKRARLDPAFFRRLRAFLKQGRYDLVHAFSFTGELWTALALATGPRIPLVSSVRGRYEGYSSLQWALKAWVARRSCAVVANSEAGADLAAERMRYPRQAIRVVRNGIAVPEPRQAAGTDAALAISPGHVAAIFVGRLVPEKNVAFLLRAMAAVPPLPQPLRLLVAGEGPQRQELERLTRELGLADRVLFLGERRDVTALLQAASFLVLPSLGEGLSNVLLEAMASGCPVLASDVPGNREAVRDGEDGILYASGSQPALTQALGRLAGDGPLRQRLAAAARERVRREYSLEAMVRSLSGIYFSCATVSSRAVAKVS